MLLYHEQRQFDQETKEIPESFSIFLIKNPNNLVQEIYFL